MRQRALEYPLVAHAFFFKKFSSIVLNLFLLLVGDAERHFLAVDLDTNMGQNQRYYPFFLGRMTVETNFLQQSFDFQSFAQYSELETDPIKEGAKRKSSKYAWTPILRHRSSWENTVIIFEDHRGELPHLK